MGLGKDLQLDRLYREGVAAIRSGDKATGKQKLMQVVQADQLHEEAWLWLSAAVDTDEERIICLENVITINPKHEVARRGLEKLGVEPPPLHEQLSAASETPKPPEPIYMTDMHAMVDGRSHKEARQMRDDISDDEAWRRTIYSEDYKPPEEAMFRERDIEQPERTIKDLMDVWVDMLYFNTLRGFDDEVKYGGFKHVAINVVVAGVLQMISTLIILLLLVVLPGPKFQPPLIQSMVETADAAELDIEESAPDDTGSLGPLLLFLGIDPQQAIQEGLTEAEQSAAQATLGILAILSVVLAGYFLFSIPLIFFSEMYRSLITNAVSHWLQGKGDVIQTMHALTIATVVTQIINIPMAFIYPFLSVGLLITVSAAVAIYQIVVTAVALGRVHKFGLFLSFGVLIISQGVGGAVAGGGIFLLSALINGI